MENLGWIYCDLFHEDRMHICYQLPWLPGVGRTWRDKVLSTIEMLQAGNPARAFASKTRPKQHFDFGDLLLVNGWCYKFNTFVTILPNILCHLIYWYAVTYSSWCLCLHSLQTDNLLALHPCLLVSTLSCYPESHSLPLHASPWIQM
jgi:hypothetical protein